VAQHPDAFVASMNHRLKDYPKPQLLDFVCNIAKSKAITYSRRLCERDRKAIIAFFCEHAPGFPEGFAPPSQAQARAVQVNQLAAQADDEFQFGNWLLQGDIFADPLGFWDQSAPGDNF
jgi:hypothetical protein